MRWKPILERAGLVLVSVLLAFGVLEAGLRASLGVESDLTERLRRPSLFGDHMSDDDYWKLYYRFGGDYGPPETPDPLLGWVSRTLSRGTYEHSMEERAAGSTPVLLYGDSFAACAVPSDQCFQGLLNRDREFREEHYLLNYGVGGYGLGQILLLLRASLDRYESPVVILGLTTVDLDRTILSVRTGQKPAFDERSGQVVVVGDPIDPDPAHYFATHPPRIRSYVLRGLTVRGLLPGWLSGYWTESQKTEKKRRVNKAVIREMVEELRKRQLRFFALLFQVHGEVEADSWRTEFLVRTLEELEVPFLEARSIIRSDLQARGVDYDPWVYFDRPTEHPSSIQNALISTSIKRMVTEARR